MYLNVHSQYSLRYGTMSIKTLVEEALARGITQMVITDINNSTGVMEFMRECRKQKIKPIGGMEFRRDKKLLYIGIARNREGMKELNDFLSYHNLEQLLESHVRIEPLENGLYRVMEGENKLGVIYAEADGDQVVWDSQDTLDKDFIQQIGELITEHNM